MLGNIVNTSVIEDLHCMLDMKLKFFLNLKIIIIIFKFKENFQISFSRVV